MKDMLGGEDSEKPDVEKPDLAPGRTGTPRVILALANHGKTPDGWDRAKGCGQLLMF
jgi:hypothetical protein